MGQSPLRNQRALRAGAAWAAGLTAVLVAGMLAPQPAVALTLASSSGRFESVGRGIQLTTDWVLTVAHVAANPGDSYTNGWGTREIAARYAFDASPFPQHDIALLRLTADAAAAGVPQVAVLGVPWAAGPLGPLDVRIVTGVSASERLWASTQVHQAVDLIDPDDAGPLTAVPVNWLLSLDDAVYVEGGDSGGSLFAGPVSDTGVLIGLISAQLQDDLGAPTGSGFVQPGAYRAWIDDTMAADLADAQQVAWVSAVPEPRGVAMWLAGGAALWAMQRRRRARVPEGPGRAG